ncbi:uncharacterized protein YcnI [Homoserinimonas aerilata]|uniref:Uncharacterized protein YcnI n=1 Tax=Homoserinimonas aerilata TaxID=1162970 RepID=A0A542YI19_9MICO|nr:YcnI family protein [Homoserinimonas aerilata]TQL47750.1 uncharacterized protein YcnI [Homoserinimonas aerilata]
MRIATKSAIAVGGGILLVAAAPFAANAHVTVTPSGTAAGSYQVLTFAVGHGCEGSSTTALTFSIPDSIESVTPTVNPGWTISDGDGTITYTAITPLIDHQRDTFALSVLLPEGEAGDTLAFPVLQECEIGQTDWSEIAEDGAEEPAHPAPVLTLSESTGDAHGHGGAEASEDDTAHADAADEVTQPDLLARSFGIGGLVLGAIGLVLGLRAVRRPATPKAESPQAESQKTETQEAGK